LEDLVGSQLLLLLLFASVGLVVLDLIHNKELDLGVLTINYLDLGGDLLDDVSN
jgi:hypothetical protein